MSKSSDFEYDLDSILAEFSSQADAPSAEAPAPKPKPAPTPAQAPAAARPAAKAAPKAAAPKASRRPAAAIQAQPVAGARPSAPVEEPTVLRPKPAGQPAAVKAPRRPETPPPVAQGSPAGRRRMRGAIGFVFVILSILALYWLCLHVHPDVGQAAAGRRENLPAQLDLYAGSAVSAALGEASALPKLYAIPENAAAPKPDPARFGSTDDPAQVQAVIDAAAELLDGQPLAWNPEAQFFPGSTFKYYLDDSLFVLCWKEILDGKCCSCAEVKIVDGSQLRRKLAQDSYGSSVQLYATQMAREANAVVAINGDFYAFRNLGITVYQRQLYRCNPATVDSCFFTAGGDMLFAYAGQLKNEAEVTQFLTDHDIVFSLAFGPVLVDDGQLKEVSPSYPIGEVDHYYSRSSVGMLGELHYLLMTVNFEGECQHTCTIGQSGEFMYRKGCQKAYALDGGQTSILVFNGEAYNRVDWDSERSMSDILYFASAVHKEEVSS